MIATLYRRCHRWLVRPRSEATSPLPEPVEIADPMIIELDIDPRNTPNAPALLRLLADQLQKRGIQVRAKRLPGQELWRTCLSKVRFRRKADCMKSGQHGYWCPWCRGFHRTGEVKPIQNRVLTDSIAKALRSLAPDEPKKRSKNNFTPVSL